MLLPPKVAMDQRDYLAQEVMVFARDTLAVRLRFINPALSRLSLQPARWSLATDGVRLFYDPEYILHSYAKEPNRVNRDYLHVVLHGVFQHFYVNKAVNHALWDLACDMAVESMLSELGLDCLQVERQARQQAVLAPFYKALGQLSAERLYHHLLRQQPSEDELQRWHRLFLADEHEAWYIHSLDDELSTSGERTAPEAGESDKVDEIADTAAWPERLDRFSRQKKQLQEQWSQVAEQMQVELEMFAQKAGAKASGMLQNLAEVNRERYDYARFLQKFAARGEVMSVNDDEFDYIFYTYGLALYGNVPLIEPLEYKDVKRIKELVIAIDTSGSTVGEPVQSFVQKTYNILLQQENFFSKVNLHLILADAAVQRDIKITNKEEFERAILNLELKGGGGTDFRPTFKHVDDLIRHHEFSNLLGMLYFTDGEGTYPEKQPDYPCAFIFVQDGYREPTVPVWAMKLVLQQHELKEQDKQ